MKRLIYLLPITALLILSACKQTDKKMAAIEQRIKDNALGMEIGYKPGTQQPEITVKAGKSIENLLKYNMGEGIDADSAIVMLDFLVNQAREQNNVPEYQMYSYMKSRITSLKTLKPDDTDYQVIKYTYTIDNLLAKGERNTVTYYYYFNAQDSLLGDLSDTKLDSYKKSLIRYNEEPYENGLYTLVTE